MAPGHDCNTAVKLILANRKKKVQELYDDFVPVDL